MLLQHYYELCNTNEPSSIFVYPPPISNIESLSWSTISSLDSQSFGENRADVNVQQQTTSEVADTETVMSDNEELDLPPPQDISNVFAEAYLSSRASSDSAKYKRAWLKAKLIRSSIFLLGNVQTHAVEYYPLRLIIDKLHPLWRWPAPFCQKYMPMQLPNINNCLNPHNITG